jgi:hypothetical protein
MNPTAAGQRASMQGANAHFASQQRRRGHPFWALVWSALTIISLALLALVFIAAAWGIWQIETAPMAGGGGCDDGYCKQSRHAPRASGGGPSYSGGGPSYEGPSTLLYGL